MGEGAAAAFAAFAAFAAASQSASAGKSGSAISSAAITERRVEPPAALAKAGAEVKAKATGANGLDVGIGFSAAFAAASRSPRGSRAGILRQMVQGEGVAKGKGVSLAMLPTAATRERQAERRAEQAEEEAAQDRCSPCLAMRLTLYI